MQPLKERILQESKPLGRDVIKVDSFLNHQVDPDLMLEIGRALAARFQDTQPSKVLTVETSGVAPAFATAAALHVPLVIARKRRAAGMPRELLQESTLSTSTGQIVDLFASPEFITTADRVLVIDAFMTTAQGLLALVRLAEHGGARVVGIGTVIEKVFEGGREKLEKLGVPVHALVRIGSIDDAEIRFI
jgi:xanthine phosphoribosyltransferase